MPGSIVVGIDGSQDSLAALRWAANRAVLLSTAARAVHVCAPPSRFGSLKTRHRTPWGSCPHDASDIESVLVEALTREGGRSTDIEYQVVGGAPEAVLVDLSHDADLLVIGATGREQGTTTTAPFPGPTARFLVRHAACPVSVVRSSHTSGRPPPSGLQPAVRQGEIRATAHALRST